MLVPTTTTIAITPERRSSKTVLADVFVMFELLTRNTQRVVKKFGKNDRVFRLRGSVNCGQGSAVGTARCHFAAGRAARMGELFSGFKRFYCGTNGRISALGCAPS
jgi:hypothetical protein